MSRNILKSTMVAYSIKNHTEIIKHKILEISFLANYTVCLVEDYGIVSFHKSKPYSKGESILYPSLKSMKISNNNKYYYNKNKLLEIEAEMENHKQQYELHLKKYKLLETEYENAESTYKPPYLDKLDKLIELEKEAIRKYHLGAPCIHN